MRSPAVEAPEGPGTAVCRVWDVCSSGRTLLLPQPSIRVLWRKPVGYRWTPNICIFILVSGAPGATKEGASLP